MINHQVFLNGAGLGWTTPGNLWMIGQTPNTAYLVDGSVRLRGRPWISENPSRERSPQAYSNIQVTVNTAGMAPGVYQATLTFVTDSGRQPTFSVPVRLVVAAYQQGFNSGGSAYTDGIRDPLAADRAYTAANGSGYVQSPSKTASTSKPIAGTTDDPLYQNARITPMNYRFTELPAGTYQVELRFAEIQSKKPGKRQFDVIVNGMPFLIAFDIAALVGENATLDRTPSRSAGGEINVQSGARSFGDPIPERGSCDASARP